MLTVMPEACHLTCFCSVGGSLGLWSVRHTIFLWLESLPFFVGRGGLWLWLDLPSPPPLSCILFTLLDYRCPMVLADDKYACNDAGDEIIHAHARLISNNNYNIKHCLIQQQTKDRLLGTNQLEGHMVPHLRQFPIRE